MEITAAVALSNAANSRGDRLTMISVKRISDLKEALSRFEMENELNGFQQWIVRDLYSYDIPTKPYPIRSVILVAIRSAPYAEALFAHGGKRYKIYALPASGEERTERYVRSALKQLGYSATPAGRLPLKRLAVQSGLADYGRNNVTYVEELGSFFSYAAFFSDAPCEGDMWRDACVSPACEGCARCVEHCPTGAIVKDRFLIDNTRCLSAMNEGGGEFPDWLPESAHHTAFDCLKCQFICPMNGERLKFTPEVFAFTEEETARVLEGAPYKDVPAELLKKIRALALDKWPDGIPRNLKVLFDQMDGGYVPSTL